MINYLFNCDVGGFRFGPDEPAGGAAAPAAAASPAPAASTPSPSPAAPAAGQTTTVPAASSTPAGSSETPAGGTPAPAAAAPASWLDGFRAAGFQTQETDETRVRAQLIQDARDAQQLRGLAPLATEYQQHQTEFQEFLQNKKKQQQQVAAESDWTKQLGWNPPEYDPNWVTQLQRKEDGSIVALPGAPADLPLKYQRYQAWRQQEVDKFIGNPFKYMEPAIKHLAGQIAAEQAQQNVGTYRDQVQAQTFIQKNSDWLFELDPATKDVKYELKFNAQTGRHDRNQVLSPHGRMFVERMQDYSKQGFTPEQQQDFAFKDVRLAYMQSPEYQNHLLSQRQAAAGQQTSGTAPAAPVQTAREQANAAFTQKTNPATPPAPSAGGNAVPAPQKVTKDNLAEVLLKRMKEQGVTVN